MPRRTSTSLCMTSNPRRERRLADEYDAAQDRGEVARHGGERTNVPDGNVATAEDIGLLWCAWATLPIFHPRLGSDRVSARRPCALSSPRPTHRPRPLA